MAKLKYYSLDAILAKNAHYSMIIGERSNGKTTAVLSYILEQYVKHGSAAAYVRRYEDDIKGSRGDAVWSGILQLGILEKLTGGAWTNIIYKGRAWYLAVPDPEQEGRFILDDRPFCHAFALTLQERYKGNSYPEIRTVMFDEFMSRTGYLHDEFVIFMNLLSTIIRQRDDVRIFMCGNTVSKYCPYFSEMGLDHIKDMEKGSIDMYSYGQSKLRVAVEFADFPSKQKPSDVYFAFNNPQLQMITGQGGVWEMALYPHCPTKIKPKDIIYTYFIRFDGDLLQCEIVNDEQGVFTFIHRKTTDLQDPDKDLVFTPDYDIRPNWRRRITEPQDRIGRKIAEFYDQDRVYYQDNQIGEIVRNYFLWCRTE